MRDDDLDEGTDICIAGRSLQNALFYAVYLFSFGMNSFLLNLIVCFFARVYAEIVQINFELKTQKLMSRNSVMHNFMQ